MSPLGRIGVTKISVTFPLASKIPYWLLKTVAIPSPASSQPFLPIPPLQQVGAPNDLHSLCTAQSSAVRRGIVQTKCHFYIGHQFPFLVTQVAFFGFLYGTGAFLVVKVYLREFLGRALLHRIYFGLQCIIPELLQLLGELL